MKKVVASLLLVASASAFAGGHHGHGGHGYWRHEGSGWGWVAPAVVGGVIGYSIARPPVYQQPAPVVIQQQPVIVQSQSCSPWTQIYNPDGTVTMTRTCTQ